MPSLPKDLRNLLSRITLAAREQAEDGARAALENLAVHERTYRSHMSEEQKKLRRKLRARGQALGDVLHNNGEQELDHLIAEAAYEHWHRLLFTRFLTENDLLRTEAEYGFTKITLAECEELKSEFGLRDGFEVANRFASKILPGVFRSNDPVLEMRLAKDDEVALMKLLDALPPEVFTADDSLGWTYQFWQAKKKDEVNASGKKIGADEISPVTQLFTEDYMVDFLLHNTLGAWWAGKKGPIHAADEAEARRHVALPERDGLPAIEWSYLRFVKDEENGTWKPAAGTFEGWPKQAKEITLLDPCMGSGHFLVFALPIIARLRMEGEGLNAQEAVAAALRDNIHGLELELRCTQIGAFNVALTAWKLAGFQQLPAPHIACSGLAPQAKLTDWLKLAGDDERMKEGMKRLYELFKHAPIFGSLLKPQQAWDLMSAGYDELSGLLEHALIVDQAERYDHEMVITAQGVSTAAKLLARPFTLISTNFPFLTRNTQDQSLQRWASREYPASKADLSTMMLERSLASLSEKGSIACVIPQHWQFLKRYQAFRLTLIENASINLFARLGTGAFEQISGEVVNVALYVFTNSRAEDHHAFRAVNCEKGSVETKKLRLAEEACLTLSQQGQLSNPECRIVLDPSNGALLSSVASCWQGIATSDVNRFEFSFWELDVLGRGWTPLQSRPKAPTYYDGRSNIIYWEDGNGVATEICQKGAMFRGATAWGKSGISITQFSSLHATLYTGEHFDGNAHALVPNDPDDLPALWCYVTSPSFKQAISGLTSAMAIKNNVITKVPFDLDHWRKVAKEAYPAGLPLPPGGDPTQWLFSGHPVDSEQTLHVAVARLLNYRWPRQTGCSFPDCPALEPDGLEAHADADGIVCLPPINQEQPAAARLRQLLAAALGSYDERALIAATGSTKRDLEEWLREDLFEQHCKLFHHRPFIWHVWDGRKDGFHALVNYHQLDNANLQKLTYSYLGDWIRLQEDGVQAEQPGAAERLGAAKDLQKELAKILEGEAPYDIFVRWKPLSQQAIGWHPDLNDGVRLNIRPFMKASDVKQKGAGLLRWKPNIKWDKDRGKEPQRDKAEYPWFWCEDPPDEDPSGGNSFTGNRWNDVHLSLEKKRKAKK